MANSATGGAADHNTKIIEEFRANQGRVGGPWAGTTLILIHHIGARSGVERVTPLGCSSQGDDRFVIVASSGGSPIHPDWYYNLKANPRIKVEVGTQTFTVLAEELDDTQKAFLFERMYRHYKVNRMASKARRIVQAIFRLLLAEPECLPTEWRVQVDRPGGGNTIHLKQDLTGSYKILMKERTGRRTVHH